MFKEWDFLLAEIWVLLALAALIGLIAGWLIWGGRKQAASSGDLARLQAELDRERARNSRQSSDPLDDVPPMEGGGYRRPTPVAPPPAKPAAEPAPDLASQTKPAERTAPAAPSAAKPAALSQPRDGLADDLTRIKGVGRKMEKLCNDLGFWHFDQIASWTADEIAWVDDNLEGFKGRVTRDNWVDQARALAGPSAPPAFVRRKD